MLGAPQIAALAYTEQGLANAPGLILAIHPVSAYETVAPPMQAPRRRTPLSASGILAAPAQTEVSLLGSPRQCLKGMARSYGSTTAPTFPSDSLWTAG